MSHPNSLEDIVITRQEEQMPLLKAYVEGKIDFPSTSTNTILLYGGCGSGKTQLANLLPDLIEKARDSEGLGSTDGVQYESKFISCGGQSASEKQREIRFIRERMNSGFLPRSGMYRYFILDEVDEWRSEQSSLKSLLSNADPRSVFILTTNHYHRLDNGLISRSICFEMDKVEPDRYLPILRNYYPFTKEIGDSQLIDLVRLANSDWRELKRLISELQWRLNCQP